MKKLYIAPVFSLTHAFLERKWLKSAFWIGICSLILLHTYNFILVSVSVSCDFYNRFFNSFITVPVTSIIALLTSILFLIQILNSILQKDAKRFFLTVLGALAVLVFVYFTFDDILYYCSFTDLPTCLFGCDL